MFRRKNTGSLPLTGLPQQQIPDGSGRKIHMDAPLWRAWKNADGYIKGSYILLVFSILLMISGYRALRYYNSSIWLTCTAEDCTLQITPVGRKGTIEVDFGRKQLLAAKSIKVNKDGMFVKLSDDSSSSVLDSSFADRRKNKGKSKNKYRPGFERGPDKDGNYDSYHLILQPLTKEQEAASRRRRRPLENENENEGDDDDEIVVSDFEAIKDYTRVDDNGLVVLQMRTFNLGETRRRSSILVNKVDAYVKKRRHRLVIKENSGISFRGIFSLVLGLFILCLTVLLGQFMEDPRPPRRQGGPGARRQQPAARRPATPKAKSNLKYSTTRKQY